MMMPMKNQFEQICNAEAAKELGVPVIKKIDKNFVAKLTTWVKEEQKIEVNFPNQTEQIIAQLFKDFKA